MAIISYHELHLPKLQKKLFLYIKIAENPSDLNKIYRLRYDVFCQEMHSLAPEDYSEKIECDAYDDFATHLMLCQDNGNLVGTLRMIQDSQNGFLMEEHFVLPTNLDRTKTLEPSRLILASELRGYDLSRLLDEAAEKWSLQNNFHIWCLAIQVHLFKKRFERGWHMQKLGEAAIYHNTFVFPILRYLKPS